MNINEHIKKILEEGKEVENRKISQILIKYNDDKENASVFKVPLKLLKYNIQNGRIATFCVQNKDLFQTLNSIEIKNAIKDNIISTDKTAHEKTKNNIKMIGQEEPGIILLDGTVIDGNRRFTCLLELNEENPDDENFKYFNAIILKGDVDSKTLKELELNVQLGKDEKVNYNLMDRYMDVYNVIQLQQKLTIEEYAKSSNHSIKDIKEIIDIISIMNDYLNFLKKEEKWEIIKAKKKLEHFKEIYNCLKNVDLKSDKENIKTIVFDYIVTEVPDADSKSIRNLTKNITKNKNDKQNWFDFINDHSYSHEKIKDIIEKNNIQTFEKIEEKLKNDDELIENLKNNLDNFMYNNHLNEEKNKLISHLNKILFNIKSINNIIDWSDIKKQKKYDYEEFLKIFNLLENVYEESKNYFNHINEIKKEED